MAESLGSAVLTLLTNDRELNEGLDRARDRVQSAADDMQARGARMQNVGAKLSMAVTAPIAGAGAAVLANAKAIADSVPEIENFARLSGVGTTEFQRLAGASRTVGIEGDKLSDIYKDMQDRVGDFLQTGGGPMADFFKKIAPTVGVTAEQFRNLSGPEALQLFYSSLEKAGVSASEMTFYMEAMASDATGLIPLLANGGKAFDELGAKANVLTPEQIEMFKRYNAAQLQMEQSTQKLTVAIVSSGLLDGITNLVTKAADFAGRLSQTNPGMMQFALAAAAVLAAIGPLLMTLGLMTSGFGTLMGAVAAGGTAFSALSTALAAARAASLGLLPALAPFLIPLAAIAAAVGLVYLAWQNWDTIKALLDRVGAAVSSWWTGTVQPVLTAIGAVVQKVFGILSDYFGAQLQRIVTAVSALLRGDFAGAWRAVEGFVAAPIRAALAVVEAFAPGVSGAFQRVYSAVKEWLQDKLRGIFDWFGGRIAWLKDLIDGMVEAGSIFALAVSPSPGTAIIIDDGKGDPPPSAPPPPPPPPAAGAGASTPPAVPPAAEAEWREGFRRSFTEGTRAALNGDLQGFLARWLEGGATRGLEAAFDAVGGLLEQLFGGAGGGKGGGIGAILSSLFAGGFESGGLIPSGKFGLVGEAGPELAIPTPRGTMIQSNRSLLGAMQPAPAMPPRLGRLELAVTVNGARGNREVSEMVAAGVREGLAGYDQVVADRVREQVARRS
ncbi:hypothetical protein [Sphingomonas sp. VNH70]|uniref:hypothetical protein n=1 Tax=Sphingomonas silueang TaxID=3156617 RepID=UPI0032B4C8DF